MITGYRQLTPAEIDVVNKIKEVGKELETLVGLLRSVPTFDTRWIDVGTTDLQTGLMALVRAVTRPTTFA